MNDQQGGERVGSRRRSTRCALAAAVVSVVGLSHIARLAHARTTVSWTVPVSGGWFDTPHWSSDQPPNASDADVVIASPGASFTVGLQQSQSATIRTLTIGSNNATLRFNGNAALTIAPGAGNGVDVNAGTLLLDNGGSMIGGRLSTVGGGNAILASCTLDGMTLAGPMRSSAPNIIVRNNIALDNASMNVTSGRIVFAGGTQTISGTGTITLGPNATIDTSTPTDLTFGPGITIYGQGYVGGGTGNRMIQGALISNGTMHIYDGVNNSFTNGGLLDAAGGTIHFYPAVAVTNFTAGKLTGGSWAARNGHDLQFTAGTITTNDATIILQGAGSSFTGLSLQKNLGTLSLSSGQTFVTPGAVVNDGTIGIATGATMLLNAGTLTNNGTFTVTNGGAFILNNIANNGTIAISDSTLRVTSIAALSAPLGTFTVSGGTLDMAVSSAYTTADLQPMLNAITGGVQLDVSGGTFDLGGGTLPVVGPKVTTRLAGGAISNGAITSPGNAPLAATRGTSTLSNVNLQADCNVADGATLQLDNTVVDGRRITLSSSVGNAEIWSAGTVGSNVPGAAPATIEFVNAGKNRIRSGPSPSMSLGANVTVRTTAGSGSLGAAGSGFANAGTVLAIGNSRTINATGTFSNSGTMIASSGGTIRLADAAVSNGQMPAINAWSNTGIIRADAGGTIVIGGTIRTADIGVVSNNGGTVTFSAFVDNTNATLALDAATGSWRSVSSTIEGGTIATSGGAKLFLGTSSITTLDNVTNTGTIANGAFANLYLFGYSRNTGSIEEQVNAVNFGNLINTGTIATHSIDGGGITNSGTLTVRDGGRISGLGSYSQRSAAFTRIGAGGMLNTTGVNVSNGTLIVESGGAANIADTLEVTLGGVLAINGGAVSVGTLLLTNTRAIESGNITLPLHAGALTITQSKGMLDLTDDDLIVGAGTPTATIVGYLKSGYHLGASDGPGINSSTARDNPTGNTVLGVLTGKEYLDNSGSGSFDGVSVNATDALVKYTYFGDVDFNGQIDVSDYNLIDFGFVNHLTGWANGDADYSGSVDISDYNLIDLAFTTQNGTLRRAIAYLDGSDRSTRGMNDDPSLQKVVRHFGEFGTAYAQGFLAAVPEPSSLISAGTLACGALLRRRRGRRA